MIGLRCTKFAVCGCCVCVHLIRGLLGGHSMAVMLKEGGQHMQWYQDELLHMAKDLGLRLLPAFNTSSGLPYPRVRQKHLGGITDRM